MITQQQFIETISQKIEAPEGEECRPNTQGFGNALASVVLKLSEEPGTFREALDELIDKRLELAVQGNDYEVIKTLMLFPTTRAKGVSSLGMHGRSITGIAENTGYKELYRRLLSTCFDSGQIIFEKRYQFSEERQWVQKMEFVKDEKQIFIYHAANEEVPDILTYLQHIWEAVLNSASQTEALNQKEAIKWIARFEWWFIAPNITGNAGASLGNCLSLVLQLYLNLPIKTGFQHIDWDILTMALEDYIAFRCHNW